MLTNEIIYKNLSEIYPLDRIKCGEPMKNHTSLSVGGNAEFLVEPINEKEIVDTVNLANDNNIKYYIIGRGSNLLVKEEGLKGIVIKISDKFSGIERNGFALTIKSGTPLAYVSKYALKESLAGIEFASGIPGSVGGAIAMNAGAYGGEIKDVVKSVRLIDDKGNIKVLTNEQMQFSYRRSLLAEQTQYIVISIDIELKEGNKEEIFMEMNTRSEKRASSQPLHKCNCGSTFKRPQGDFAGRLIEECGLKGYTYNGVEVSSIHAGFVVNNGKSTSNDMLYVIDLIKEKVFEKFGVKLEEEVKII